MARSSVTGWLQAGPRTWWSVRCSGSSRPNGPRRDWFTSWCIAGTTRPLTSQGMRSPSAMGHLQSPAAVIETGFSLTGCICATILIAATGSMMLQLMVSTISDRPQSVLVTGASSGFGRYLLEALNGIPFKRGDDLGALARDSGYFDAIIHCAVNTRSVTDGEALFEYLDDNVLLTERLTNLPHHRFVYISTVDVYPANTDTCREDQEIDLGQVHGAYAITKLLSEAIVRARANGWLILRPTAMLGQHIRKNSLVRMLEYGSCELTLSGDSEFNYVLHEDVAAFVTHCLRNGRGGIFNVASAGNIRLRDLARDFALGLVRFGSHVYKTGNIDQSKVSAEYPAFTKTSRQVVEQFIQRFQNV